MNGGDGAATADGFSERVVEIVAGLGPGEVVTYGEVAAEAGRPGAARAVGRVLRASEGLPWWRVVRADGRLALGDEQADRLRAEGVRLLGANTSVRVQTP